MTTNPYPDPVAGARRRNTGPAVVAIVVVAIIATCIAAVLPAFSRGAARRAHRMALTPDKSVDGLRMPPFTLTSQNGTPVTNEMLQGHVTILDFVFTNCTFVCPTLTQKMLHLQENLSDTGVRLLSISVDPERDTPQRLREHAERIGADLSRWTFATGPWDEILRISESGLKLGLGPDPNPENIIVLDDDSTMQNIAHTSRLVLLGPDGAVLGLYNGLEQAEVDLLAGRVRAASESR